MSNIILLDEVRKKRHLRLIARMVCIWTLVLDCEDEALVDEILGTKREDITEVMVDRWEHALGICHTNYK